VSLDALSLVKRFFSSLSQRAVENIVLIVVAAVVYSLEMTTVPPKLHIFESWAKIQLDWIQQGWPKLWEEYGRFGTNDTNAAVRCPFWILMIYSSLKVVGDEVLAFRIPSVFLTALTPVLLAEIVRRFFRKDMALLAGLACLGHQHLMFYGRIAGYVAPTTTLITALMLCSMCVAWGNSRRAWIPLTLCFMLMPFFYSTVRYMCFMGVGIIALSFIRSSEFRRRHAIPALVSCCVFGLPFIYLLGPTPIHELTLFFGARGENYLVMDRVVQGAAPQMSLVERLVNLFTTTVPENFRNVPLNYWGGQRFFDWHYQGLYFYEHKVLTVMFVIGFITACVLSFRKPRYLLMIVWSLLAWVPLLFTTGITNNRMMSGVPADMFLVTLAAMLVIDLFTKVCGYRFRWVWYGAAGAAACYLIYFSAYRLIVDCRLFCL
jgi:hypothetical protein